MSGRGKGGNESPGSSSSNAGFSSADVLLASQSTSGAIYSMEPAPKQKIPANIEKEKSDGRESSDGERRNEEKGRFDQY
jgi:hypothetical protein